VVKLCTFAKFSNHGKCFDLLLLAWTQLLSRNPMTAGDSQISTPAKLLWGRRSKCRQL